MFYGLERLLGTDSDAEGLPGQIRQHPTISRKLAISRSLSTRYYGKYRQLILDRYEQRVRVAPGSKREDEAPHVHRS